MHITFFLYSFRRNESVMKLDSQKIAYMDLTYCVEGEMHYVYEGEELPEDFICPLCKHGASEFEEIK